MAIPAAWQIRMCTMKAIRHAFFAAGFRSGAGLRFEARRGVAAGLRPVAAARTGAVGCALCLALVLAAPAAAQPASQRAGGNAAPSADCAALGPGFAKMNGSDSCVRIRSGVRVDGMMGGTLSNNSSFGNTATDLSVSAPAPADPWKQAR